MEFIPFPVLKLIFTPHRLTSSVHGDTDWSISKIALQSVKVSLTLSQVCRDRGKKGNAKVQH